jgi:hypothetical protein
MDRENSATKLSPVAAGHNLLHPPLPIPYPCPVINFLFHNFIMRVIIIITTYYE